MSNRYATPSCSGQNPHLVYKYHVIFPQRCQMVLPNLFFFPVNWFGRNSIPLWPVLLPPLLWQGHDPSWYLTARCSHHISYVSQIWNISFGVQRNSLPAPTRSARTTYYSRDKKLGSILKTLTKRVTKHENMANKECQLLNIPGLSHSPIL